LLQQFVAVVYTLSCSNVWLSFVGWTVCAKLSS